MVKSPLVVKNMVEDSIPLYWRTIGHRYRFSGRECPECGRVYFPPRPLCLDCGVKTQDEKPVSRVGKVISFSEVHMAQEHREDEVPYVVALIELEDGNRVIGQIVGVPFSKIKTGMKVRYSFRKYGAASDDSVLRYGYKFVPEEYPNIQ